MLEWVGGCGVCVWGGAGCLFVVQGCFLVFRRGSVCAVKGLAFESFACAVSVRRVKIERDADDDFPKGTKLIAPNVLT